jgi:hypothetical protein
MRKTISPLVTLLVFLLVGCSPVSNTPTLQPVDESPSPQLPTLTIATPTAESSVLTLEALKNNTYFVPYYQKTVTLVDGKYGNGTGNDPLNVNLLPEVAFGDLNGDGTQDAAILLAENGGGSGVFVSVGAVLDQNGTLVQVNNFASIDDRPVIESLAIKDGRIVLDALVHAPNDPMVSPTMKTSLTYAVSNGTLWLTRMTSAMQSGNEHNINIESPSSGSEVDSSVEMKGNMPIGPFENTLGYFITDASGKRLVSGSFMVSTADVGAPATFDATIDLAGIASGTIIRVSLFEEDMSGFREYRALDAVELKVK